jgi:hypothetical protein
MKLRMLPAACAGLLLAACAAGPAVSTQEVQSAWIQFAVPGAAGSGWTARAVTQAPSCPVMVWTGGQLQMQVRSEPATVAPRSGKSQPDVKPAEFPARTCEAAVPDGVRHVLVGKFELNTPPPVIEHLLLIGDTGCRMKQSENAFQACNDLVQWPFPAVARNAALKHPDLVVHVGDIHYRESPCPEGNAGCAGSVWGYGLDAWQADFLVPAAPLLAAAPWVFVRGNHESCNRAGAGWFRFLDARAWTETGSCNEPQHDAIGNFSEPFAVPLSPDTQLIIFDSSFTAGRAYASDDPVFKQYAQQLLQVEVLTKQKPHSFFLNHHPVLGFGDSANGTPKPGNGGLYSVMSASHPKRLYADGVDMVLNGHVHQFEALSFSSGHPAALVLGNSGSAMGWTINETAARLAQPAPGAVVETFITQPGFGFATLDRTESGWHLTEWSVEGKALKTCEITGTHLSCGDAH